MTDQAAVLAERRASVQARLVSLRNAASDALLGGSDLDAIEVARAEAELEAIAYAEGELVRRERTAALEAYRGQQGQLRRHLLDLAERRLAVVAEAEQATRALADALARHDALVVEMLSTAHQITGRPVLGISRADAMKSLSHRFSAVLDAKLRLNKRFGDVDLFTHPLTRADDDWSKAERSRSDDVMQAILDTEIQ